MKENDAANERAVRAKESLENLDRFLLEEQKHILHLTGKVLKKNISASDDEYSIALTAVSEAVGSYDDSKGDFWSYAAFVIKSREVDYYRKNAKTGENELTVSPELFGGETEDDDPGTGALQKDINEKTATVADTGLKDEIEALSSKLKDYGISFFDLAECSPKAEKSRSACSMVIKAIFTPPPLIEEIMKSKALPIKKILEREKGVSRKLIDRHRKYLISAAVILTGDYPGIAEYIPYSKDIREITGARA